MFSENVLRNIHRVSRMRLGQKCQQQQQLFNGPLSVTAQVSWYQEGKTNLDFSKSRDSEWLWH